jgi:endonuclease YncB( thermonuclease family)
MPKTLNIILILISFNVFCFGQTALNGYFKVIKIIDGDTYDILVNGKAVRIRVDAIDAPERSMPFGKVSKSYLASLIAGKSIHVIQKDIDMHHRVVGRAFMNHDALDISKEMIRAGMAWHYLKYSNDPILHQTEQIARSKRIGLWSDPNAQAPWDYRKEKRKRKNKPAIR